MFISLDNALYSYQKKIGSYDKQSWDKSIEERVLRGLNPIPKKVAKIKTELIDLDLIRGSPKSKSQHGWLSSLGSGINRVLFYPFYLKWWSEQTNNYLACLFLSLYILQGISMRIYFENGFITSSEFAEVPTSEVLSPLVMMLVLGILHSQIVGTKSSKRKHNFGENYSSRNNNNNKRPKKSKSYLENQYFKPASDEESYTSGHGSLDFNLTNEQKFTKQSLLQRRKINNLKLQIPRIEVQRRNSSENEDKDSSGDEFSKLSHQSFWRRYSDSKSFVGKSRTDKNEYDFIFRRNSEGSKKTNIIQNNLKCKKKNLQNQMHLLPPNCLQNSCSSCESEGTLSPPYTPTCNTLAGIGALGSEYSPLNSDGSSDEESQQELQEPNSTCESKYFSVFADIPNEKTSSTVFSTINEDGKEDNGDIKGRRKGVVRVSCNVWQQNECQKVDLSVVDISSIIIRKVDHIKHSSEYLYLGIIFSVILALLPGLFRIQQNGIAASNAQSNVSEIVDLLNFPALDLSFVAECVFGSNWRICLVVIVAMIQRLVLSTVYFFLLCVAERTFRDRFLYAKYFSQITRRDRAKRSEVPHFRLHKVKNLKVWLSVRSYLKRNGPLRTVDAICSSSFIIAVCILTFICLQLLKENEICSAKLYCWEMVFWNFAIGIYIMRLMILGSRINRKYRGNLSVLITEQINLYLQLEQKPHKKEELTLANHVLKLAADLLKELESPYKITGFCANPYLYNITKVVVLSAFSAVLTELLGFKLKLHKIKIR